MKGEILSIETVEKIASLEKRIKELETINEEHRKLNGELREIINDAIKYINTKYNILLLSNPPQQAFKKEELLNILQGSDE